ncbi:hypothetical protein EDD16DRAFT_1707685 [Pisolithus croceorrhizus]|nr:hypothetical protein EV401DRAFT_2079144 [Pisolithus croceorrhizus]KAI6117359.1 hypothetical protein EDD16DRAFT_1707685 [Pisolithus croceorrhizus]KAI6161510.1 hypothetical protein EDD17DRAFT_1759303 [Pisolithus thermaeus]
MFMAVTYSHESKQVAVLQGQVMKLTVENNALRMAFQCLAGAVGLRNIDPCQIDGSTFPQVSTSLKPKRELAPPTLNDFPLVQFWEWEDWEKYLELPEGQTSKAWVELMHRKLAPLSWGRLSATACQFVHDLMEGTYPDFKFANNGWKLDYLASNTYPAWRKGKLDDNGRWKQKQGKGIKIEDDEDEDNGDDSSDDVGMKWKALASESEEPGPGKQFKVSVFPPHSSTPTLSIGSPAGTTDDSEGPSSLSDLLCNMQCDLDVVTSSVISIDPLAMFAHAASKA